jgi:hypothetical protein
MKTILAIAAVVGFAIAAPSLALAHGGEKHTGVKTPPVKKQLVVKPGKLRLTAKLACAKPIIVKGVKQCPTEKGAPATK